MQPVTGDTAATWSIHPYREGDIPALVVLANAASQASGDDPPITEANLQDQYYRSGRDPSRYVLVVDGPLPEGLPPGSLIGSARAFPVENAETNEHAYEFSFRVHPALKSSLMEQSLARALLDLVDTEEARVAAESPEKAGRAITLKAFTYNTNLEGVALWEWLGMQVTRRWYWMHRLSSDPITEPRPVEGVTIHTYNKPADTEGVGAAALASFADHYDFNSAEFVAEWEYCDNVPTLRPELSWVAEDSDRNIVALCIIDVGMVKNNLTGAPAALVTYVGTIREWRGKGLARSLLLRCVQSLRDAGIEDVYLNVDADSPTGANRLYEAEGFTVLRTALQYERKLSDIKR
jgi:mycothiol synthase